MGIASVRSNSLPLQPKQGVIRKSAEESAADRALQSCIMQEEAVVDEAQRKLGAEYGPGARLRFRGDARDGIIRLITECRAASPMNRPPECLQGTPPPM